MSYVCDELAVIGQVRQGEARAHLLIYTLLCTCVQKVFADIRDDDDDEFEVVPVKPTKTDDDFSDGLCCSISDIFTACIAIL